MNHTAVSNNRCSCRGAAVFAAVVVSLVFAVNSPAQGPRQVRGEATVKAVDLKSKEATFVVDSKSRRADARPWECICTVAEDAVFRRLPSGRKVRGEIADLKAGQRVQVTILPCAITPPNWAIKVEIPAKNSK